MKLNFVLQNHINKRCCHSVKPWQRRYVIAPLPTMTAYELTPTLFCVQLMATPVRSFPIVAGTDPKVQKKKVPKKRK